MNEGRYGIFARMFAQVITHDLEIKDVSSKGIYSVEGSRIDIWSDLLIDGPTFAIDASVNGQIGINGDAVVTIENVSYGIVAQYGNSHITIVTSDAITFNNVSSLEFGAASDSRIIATALDFSTFRTMPDLNMIDDDSSRVYDKNAKNIHFKAEVYSHDTTITDIDNATSDILVTKEWVQDYAPTASGTEISERFILTSTDVGNGYIDLSDTPKTDKHLFVYLNGLLLDEDANGDFTILDDRITFTNDLANVIEQGDKIIVKYTY
jgi:hypothetical protein